MEAEIEDSQFVRDRVAAKNLDWNHQWISHQIRVHHAVKDMNGSIIRSTRHQGVSTMVLDRTQGALMVLEGLIGRARKVHIEPYHATIQTSNNNVISGWMDIYGRNPTAPRQQSYEDTRWQ